MQSKDSIARLITALLLALGLALPAAALAQPHSVVSNTVPKPPRFHFGGGLQAMQSVGAFADSVSGGIGAGANARYNLDSRGIFAIRGDIVFQVYGNERKNIPFPTAPRVTLEQNTSNSIVNYAIGPQIMWPTGSVRPYVNGFIGGSYFSTSTSLEGSRDEGEPFASSENFHDNTFSYGGGGGLHIPFKTGRVPVALDIGARYVHNGTAQYLKPGSIQDNGNEYFVNPIKGPANFIVYTLGVSIGAVSSRDRSPY